MLRHNCILFFKCISYLPYLHTHPGFTPRDKHSVSDLVHHPEALAQVTESSRMSTKGEVGHWPSHPPWLERAGLVLVPTPGTPGPSPNRAWCTVGPQWLCAGEEDPLGISRGPVCHPQPETDGMTNLPAPLPFSQTLRWSQPWTSASQQTVSWTPQFSLLTLSGQAQSHFTHWNVPQRDREGQEGQGRRPQCPTEVLRRPAPTLDTDGTCTSKGTSASFLLPWL